MQDCSISIANALEILQSCTTPSKYIMLRQLFDPQSFNYSNFLVPSHYLNQCWLIVNWTLSNKLQWNFNKNRKLSIHENASDIVVCEMAAILSGGDELICCNRSVPQLSPVTGTQCSVTSNQMEEKNGFLIRWFSNIRLCKYLSTTMINLEYQIHLTGPVDSGWKCSGHSCPNDVLFIEAWANAGSFWKYIGNIL